MAKKSEPTIMFVKPAAISAEDKITLRDAGVIVIEIDDPQDAKLVRAGTELETGALLNAAAEAVSVSEYSQRAFGKAVSEAIKLQFSKQ